MVNGAARTKRMALVWGALVTTTALSLSGCSSVKQLTHMSSVEPLERVVGPHDKVTPGGGRYQVGKPYAVNGRTYVPQENPSLDETGYASWYGGDVHHGTRTANGEVYDRDSISAAHPTMPLPSYARITALDTGRSIIVRVNDRGPYARGRVIDLSERTASLLDVKGRGVARVRVQYVGRAGLAGSDQRTLTASLRGPGLLPGADDRILVASADLPAGPRRAPEPAIAPVRAPTMVADARGAVPSNALLQKRPPLPTSARALASNQDATAFELAGVAPARLSPTVTRTPLPKPAATSAEVIEAEMPGASGAPMSLVPLPTASPRYDTSALPTGQRASYAAETRISAAFDRLSEGETLGRLPQ
ncbi:MAG: septal ring lytic transglycosylase RlpA family protein [Phyllobacteriaceae bacterium]|nr:septal ring lytic transglycosylase RlpA family protein [Phyllobacteriaceae bacterium]